MDCAVKPVSLSDRVHFAVISAVRRYDPAFADALVGDQSMSILSIPDCVRVWNAVIDEIDIVLSGDQDAKSSPFFGNPGLLDEVLDEMAELKRAVISGGGATLAGERESAGAGAHEAA